MTRWHTIVGILFFATTASAQTIYPLSVKTVAGKTSTRNLSALMLQDQSGTSTLWRNYVQFTPGASGYTGDFSFKAPMTSTNSLSFSLNYKGLPRSQQEWLISLYNNKTKSFDVIGNNGAAANETWSLLKFSVQQNASDYINAQGNLTLRYSTKSSLKRSNLDTMSISLGASTQPIPTPTPVATPVATPVITPPPVPTITPPPATPTPTPKPTATPVVTPTPATTPPPVGARSFTGVRPYGPNAPWNIPVSKLPVHPESQKYADFLWADFTKANIPELNFRKYTYAVYDATKASDQYLIKDRNNWGNLNGKMIPFNPSWIQNAGTDGQLIILDAAAGKEWNLWQAAIDTTTKQITIGNGNLCPGDYLTNNWDTKATKCTGSRGVGINYLAMLVRPWEIEKGVIEHALSMPIPSTSGDFYVAPATKLEHPGKVGTIPEGMRFALNVTTQEIDDYVNSLTGLRAENKRAIKIILTALKDYGWFITDTSGGAQLQFEAPETAQAEWERIGVLPGQSSGGLEHPRFTLRKFLTKERIKTIVPSDQYPASAFSK
ncbi:hypothetical protein [Bdellovibrio sp. HCB337]|uniref:hypothetical protein n=1 Tax=Bdellovibrio sp. HCB337 TaxID=3394358 RepID=UPI0039A6BBC2